MKLKTRSILQELNELAEIRNKDELFESRATNIINSAINLLETLKKHYTAEQADELERRLLNAIAKVLLAIGVVLDLMAVLEQLDLQAALVLVLSVALVILVALGLLVVKVYQAIKD